MSTASPTTLPLTGDHADLAPLEPMAHPAKEEGPTPSTRSQFDPSSSDPSDAEDPSVDTPVSDTLVSDDNEDATTPKKPLPKRSRQESGPAEREFSPMKAGRQLSAKRRHVAQELKLLNKDSHPEFQPYLDELNDKFEARRQKVRAVWYLRRDAIMAELEGQSEIISRSYLEFKGSLRGELLDPWKESQIRIRDWNRHFAQRNIGRRPPVTDAHLDPLDADLIAMGGRPKP
ncbi:hypothetical protein H4R33_004832 [Dimargaris cristalligena]|nr:hypothetical protein H4R33_004832 [Dimargaris cristalligena]